MDTYCWIHGTFSIPSRWVGEQVNINDTNFSFSKYENIPFCVQGTDVAHPGVAPQDPEDRTEHVYHKYYQVRKRISFISLFTFF